tara:strand:+ start:1664 stop:2914 length:1251 start_codon:yes stop_codon:yes gene_type:complete
MKFEFINNACGIFFGSNGTKILCDPWIEDGVFEGSWFHYPPLKTKLEDIQDVDAIYLSHIHPDHYDERNFNFSTKIPIILLNHGANFLKKNLQKKGYNNFIEIKDDETVNFREFELTAYKCFTSHPFEESALGNLIDSSLVIQNLDTVAINFNDNVPDEKACIKLKNKFKKIDLAMINYNAAGPYPSCFDNLDINQKKEEHLKIINRNFNHLCKVLPFLKPKSVMPFAGSYVIGGKNYEKNDYLATATWDQCADYLKKNLSINTKVFCLNENQVFDIKNQKTLAKYERIDTEEMEKYIFSLKNRKYVYEHSEMPDEQDLLKDINIAKKKFLERSKKFNTTFKTNVFLNVGNKKINIFKGTDSNRELVCSMDNRLLRRILDRKSHWNNSEIGTHINFKRSPNIMDPDIHTILSFFHL